MTLRIYDIMYYKNIMFVLSYMAHAYTRYAFAIDCPTLSVPVNGALACISFSSGTICQMQCNSMNDIPRLGDISGEWVCDTTNGLWIPHSYIPDCSDVRRPGPSYLPNSLFYFNDECMSDDTQNQIKQNFVKYLGSSQFGNWCELIVCSVKNVLAACSSDDLTTRTTPIMQSSIMTTQSTTPTQPITSTSTKSTTPTQQSTSTSTKSTTPTQQSTLTSTESTASIQPITSTSTKSTTSTQQISLTATESTIPTQSSTSTSTKRTMQTKPSTTTYIPTTSNTTANMRSHLTITRSAVPTKSFAPTHSSNTSSFINSTPTTTINATFTMPSTSSTFNQRETPSDKLKTTSNKQLEIRGVWPKVGPQAGGTLLTINGIDLIVTDIEIRIGNLVCDIQSINSTTITAVTPALFSNMTKMLGKEQEVYVIFGGTPQVSGKFMYKGNPRIDNVYPRESIIIGGIRLTVDGENFYSVAMSTMVTTMVFRQLIEENTYKYNVTTTIYHTNCQARSNSQMLCLTPELAIPAGFTEDPKHTRIKRQSDTAQPIMSNGQDTLEFYIGFQLDGVKTYENYSAIDIYIEPSFILDPGFVFDFAKNELQYFKGDGLDQGVTVDDYKITVGTDLCTGVELLQNSVSCLPPQSEPNVVDNSEHPTIMIHIGTNLAHVAGSLRYPDLTKYYIIAPAIIVALALAILVTIGVVCARRTSRP